MKYLPLLWAGLWRKPLRSILTMLSIMVAFLLFGVLQGIDAGFSDILGRSRADRLSANPRFPAGPPLPIAYEAQIGQVPGVLVISPMTFLGGFYQDPKNRMGVIFAGAGYLAVQPELLVSADQVEAWKATPTGVLVGNTIADRHGWKIGDQIPLQANTPNRQGSKAWSFEVVGIGSASTGEDANWVIGNYSYFDEARATGRGTANRYVFRIADAKQAPDISRAIDQLFANTPVPTRTQSDQERAQSQQEQFVSINLIIDGITAAVFFMLLFITSNTMMQSVRERIPEFAVLKTVGFEDRAVLGLVLAESLTLSLVAALGGLGLSTLLAPLVRSVINLPSLHLSVVLWGMVLATLVALVSGGPPAWKVRRLTVVDALAGR